MKMSTPPTLRKAITIASNSLVLSSEMVMLTKPLLSMQDQEVGPQQKAAAEALVSIRNTGMVRTST